MRWFRDINNMKQEDLEKIQNAIITFDRYLWLNHKAPTDANVALYENWIDCRYDIEKVILLPEK